MKMKLVIDAANLATVKARLQEITAIITPHKSATYFVSSCLSIHTHLCPCIIHGMFVHPSLGSCAQPCVCSLWSSWTKGGVCLKVGPAGTSKDASWQSPAHHRAAKWTRLCPWPSECQLYTAGRRSQREWGAEGGDEQVIRHDVGCRETFLAHL